MAEKLKNIPNHIAFIPDGNRRWAANHMMEVWKGHDKGTSVVKEMIKEAVRMKIPHFSFWGSSLDNIAKRSKEEVSYLFKIFKNNFTDLAKDKDIHQNKIRVNVFGRWRELFPEDVKKAIEHAIEVTKEYNEHFFNVFLAYSGIDEMEEAVRKISEEAIKNPKIKITVETIKNYLFTRQLPKVDYLIRTGGDPHLSGGFMMWETADTQLYFLDKYWPDFTVEDFRTAIEEYGRRQRKFGA
ncbi:MAG: polyprenyl diphosphate synthase [bacterium]|nr:polyprenyl diphosphate synthase [bacterium]